MSSINTEDQIKRALYSIKRVNEDNSLSEEQKEASTKRILETIVNSETDFRKILDKVAEMNHD
tara:strand:- start:863 stop:1051 length:189 start_codon:yes stop_codon:yes gene_type:complete